MRAISNIVNTHGSYHAVFSPHSVAYVAMDDLERQKVSPWNQQASLGSCLSRRSDWTDFASPRLKASFNRWFNSASRPPTQEKIPTPEIKRATRPPGCRVTLRTRPPPAFSASSVTVSGTRSRPPIRKESNQANRGCVAPALIRIASLGPGSITPPSPAKTSTCGR